jgi:hypothetical protein
MDIPKVAAVKRSGCCGGGLQVRKIWMLFKRSGFAIPQPEALRWDSPRARELGISSKPRCETVFVGKVRIDCDGRAEDCAERIKKTWLMAQAGKEVQP